MQPYTTSNQTAKSTVKTWVNQTPPPEVRAAFERQAVAVREQTRRRKAKP